MRTRQAEGGWSTAHDGRLWSRSPRSLIERSRLQYLVVLGRGLTEVKQIRHRDHGLPQCNQLEGAVQRRHPTEGDESMRVSKMWWLAPVIAATAAVIIGAGQLGTAGAQARVATTKPHGARGDLGRLSGFCRAPGGDLLNVFGDFPISWTPSHIMSPTPQPRRGSWTEVRLGARAHTIRCPTNRAHEPPTRADIQPRKPWTTRLTCGPCTSKEQSTWAASSSSR